jgi:hypothetical protein
MCGVNKQTGGEVKINGCKDNRTPAPPHFLSRKGIEKFSGGQTSNIETNYLLDNTMKSGY